MQTVFYGNIFFLLILAIELGESAVKRVKRKECDDHEKKSH